MSANAFNKTPDQLKAEIDRGVENLHRKLLTSKGFAKEGHSNLLRAVLVLFLLSGNFLFGFWFEGTGGAKQKEASASGPVTAASMSPRDAELIADQLARIDRSVEAILEQKSRVAPNLQIGGALTSISEATAVVRRLTATQPRASPTVPALVPSAAASVTAPAGASAAPQEASRPSN